MVERGTRRCFFRSMTMLGLIGASRILKCLMTFSHRAPLAEDYLQGYPIVEITLDVPWDP
jgi:hypothetical protein